MQSRAARGLIHAVLDPQARLRFEVRSPPLYQNAEGGVIRPRRSIWAWLTRRQDRNPLIHGSWVQIRGEWVRIR